MTSTSSTQVTFIEKIFFNFQAEFNETNREYHVIYGYIYLSIVQYEIIFNDFIMDSIPRKNMAIACSTVHNLRQAVTTVGHG